MSIPRCLQMPNHRIEKLQDGKLATIQRIAYQHYLVWMNGEPVTEVQCIPHDSGRWYFRGSLGLSWVKTRATAIMAGRARKFKGVRIDGKPIEPWTEKAQAAIAKAIGVTK